MLRASLVVSCVLLLVLSSLMLAPAVSENTTVEFDENLEDAEIPFPDHRIPQLSAQYTSTDHIPELQQASADSRSTPFLAWDHDEPPVGRAGSSMVYDPVGDDIYLYGGFPIIPSGDLWRYDVAAGTWEEIFYKDGPGNRTGHGMTFDTSRSEIVIWGGLSHVYETMNDMWRYNLNSGLWTQISQGTPPPKRYAMDMEYSNTSDAIFMYGGYDTQINKVYHDLYKFNITSGAWSLFSVLDSVGRYDYSMDIDQKNNTLYIYGGWNHSVGIIGDLLEVDLEDSTYNIYTPGSPGPLRESSMACMDSTFQDGDDKIYIFGGYDGLGNMRSDLWSFDMKTKAFSLIGNRSTNPGFPEDRESSAFCYKHSSMKFFIFSGRDNNGLYEDLWSFDHNSQAWTKSYIPPLRPSVRESVSLITSLENKRIYTFGGIGFNLHDDTWYYDLTTNTWTEVVTSSNPIRRFGYSASYDPVGGGIYLFGGRSYDTVDQYLNDLWYFDMDTQDWSFIIPTGTWPSNRTMAGSAVDPDTGHFYIHGGTNGISDYADLWKFDPFGVSWAEVADSNPPTKRFSHGMTEDPNGGGFFVFGGGYFDGGSGTIINNELWRYDFVSKSWTLKGGAHPPMTLHHKLVSGEDKLFLFGGFALGVFNMQNDLYVYNITQGFWTKVPKTGAVPYPRITPGMAFDPWDRDVYIFGGYGTGGGMWSYGLPYDLGITLNFTTGPTCYAMYDAYDFQVEVDHGLSTGLVDKVALVLDPGDLNITMNYDPDLDQFSVLGMSGTYLDPGASFATSDGVKSWTVHFKPNFTWGWPKPDLLDVKIVMEDKNGFSAEQQLTSVFRVETDLEFDGTLTVEAEHHGAITPGTVLLKAETLSWGGLRIVYEGTTDKYPPNAEFQVAVFDDDGDFWLDSSSTGRNISIETTTDTTNDPRDVHYVNLSGDASSFNILSVPFEIKVDTQPLIITDLKPEGGEWLRTNIVTLSAVLTDQGGLVKGSSIEYNLTQGGQGAWTNAGLDTDAVAITATKKLTLDEGIHHFRWRGTDQAGNTPVESSELEVKVDTEVPVLEAYYPNSGALLNTTSVSAWLRTSDLTSGVDPSGVQYQFSTDGGTTYSNWTTIANSGGVQVNVSADLVLAQGDQNRLVWRVLDVAGNLIKQVDPLAITVELPKQDEEIPAVTLLTPTDIGVVKTLTPTFTWDVASYSGDSDVSYNFYIQKDNNPAGKAPDARNIVKQSNTLTYELDDGVKYYWTVLPVMNGKLGDCTNGVYSFTTSYLVDLDREITLGLEVENKKVTQGLSYTINISVTNEGEITETVTMSISSAGDCPDMLSLDKTTLTIMPGDSKLVVLTIEPSQDCPTEIFVYSINADFDAGTTSKELILVVEKEGGGTTDDDDSSGGGAVVAVLVIVLLLVAIFVILVVVVLMRRGRATEREHTPPDAPEKISEKPSGKKEKPSTPAPSVKEEAAVDESYDSTPYTLASPEALDAEMDGGDIFQEAAFHKGYETAKKRIEGDDDILDLTDEFPPADQMSIEGGPDRTEIQAWDMPGLDMSNMPGSAVAPLALPPAVFMDMQDTDKNKPYSVEEILIMDNNGILLTHFSRGSAINVDEDILAGMITAIQSFVKESFSTSGKGLSDLAMGEFRIFISTGASVTFVAMVSGEGYTDIKRQLDKAVTVTEEEFSQQLYEWSGDIADMAGIEHIIRDFLDGRFE